MGRRAPAAGAHIYLGHRQVFFVTVNAKDRVPWMAQQQVQDSLHSIWLNRATAWLVGYYVIMPDHLHLFCAPRDLSFGIDAWIAFWKREFSRRHPHEPWTFQRRSFHRRMRTERDYAEKWQYVRENPLRKGIAEGLDDWPLQGTVHDPSW